MPEIYWYHYQGGSPASNIDKDPYELSVTSEPSVGGGGGQDYLGHCPQIFPFLDYEASP